MNELQAVALEEEPADLVVRGGEVLLAESGRFTQRDVAVVGDRIAALPVEADGIIDAETMVVDATDCSVIPGLIDAHTHLDAGQTFERIYHLALEGGTTTVVSEVNTFGSVLGTAGVETFLAATADLPVTVVVTVPPLGLLDLFEPPWADAGEARELQALLDRERVVGVGELTWIYIVGRSSGAAPLIERANELALPVTGHGAGCTGEELVALASIVDDDHEPIEAEGFLARVENGIHAIGRFGARDDIDALAEAYRTLGSSDHFSLCSDGIGLDRLANGHYMDRVVARAIDAGVPPAAAYRMATLTTARHFGLADRGSLTPGRVADIVVLSDRESVTVETVIADGEVVVREGEPTVGPRPHEYPDVVFDTLDVALVPADLRVPATAAGPDGRVRAIEHEFAMVTAETTVEPPVLDDALVADPAGDLVKAAAIDRHGGTCRFVGFVTGLGIRDGAVATSSAMQLPVVTVLAANDADAATAVDRLATHGGGWVVVRDGTVIAEHATPVAGVCADTPIADTLGGNADVWSALEGLGVERSDVRVGISSLVFTGVPALKLSVSGYAHVLDRELVGLDPTA